MVFFTIETMFLTLSLIPFDRPGISGLINSIKSRLNQKRKAAPVRSGFMFYFFYLSLKEMQVRNLS